VKSFLNIDLCRCLDAKTLCINKTGKLLTNKQLFSSRYQFRLIWSGFVKAEVLTKVSFTMSGMDPALRVTKAVADHYSLHRNLRLDFISGKPKTAVEHLVSVFKSATLKDLIESKQEMEKTDFRKDFLDFVAYLQRSIIHDEHCQVVEYKRLATLS
jgi:hypothetical protein